METDIDAIGTAITGGLAARAIEPHHGEGGGEERVCANCATVLIGTHCHLCGQQAHVHRTMSAIGHDLIHGVLHLDGKFWRTLPLLIRRPGELTRRYVAGERAKFVSPLGMFLFSIFLMFAVLQIYGLSLSNIDIGDGVGSRAGYAQAHRRLVEELAAVRSERRELIEAIEDNPALARQPAPGDAVVRSRRIDDLAAEIRDLERAESSMQGLRRLRFFSDEGDQSGFRTGWARLDHGIEKINDNPGLALYKLQTNSYKFSWLLIPISVPFVWILFFYTRRYRMYDHAVFVTYSLAFMSLLLVTLTVLGFAGVHAAIIALAAMLIPPFHMYRQLKGAYRLSRPGALARTFLLANFCFVTASFYFVALLGIGALG